MMKRMRTWLRQERGLAEATTAIFVLPLILAAMFVIIESGIYMQTRAVMDSITRDTARMAALDGGNYNPTTNTIGMSWSTKGTLSLKEACSKNVMRCSTVPVMSCIPVTYAMNVGDDVTCTATVSYSPVSSLSKNPVFSFGFSGLFTAPIESEAHSVAAVGING